MADPVRDRPGPDYPGLIKPDRVYGSLYTDPRVFADELTRIWYRTWVYVGHESEVGPEGHLTQLLDPSADRWRDA